MGATCNARLEAQNELLVQREESLKTQNGQLDAALTNMLQGLAMFDAQERLILANARYAELFGLSPGRGNTWYYAARNHRAPGGKGPLLRHHRG